MLSIQLNGVHDHSPCAHEPAAFLNVNGKRQMIDVSQYVLPILQMLEFLIISSPPMPSNPPTISTSLRPDRITLPPGHRPPQLASSQVISSDENVPPPHIHEEERPGSSRFAQYVSDVIRHRYLLAYNALPTADDSHTPPLKRLRCVLHNCHVHKQLLTNYSVRAKIRGCKCLHLHLQPETIHVHPLATIATPFKPYITV